MNECNVEQAVPLAPRGRVQQQTAEQVVHEPQSRERTVEAVRSIPCERVQQQAVDRMVDKSIPQIREESVVVVEKFTQEPISEKNVNKARSSK